MEPKDKKNLRVKSPEINLSMSGQMIFINGAKTIQWGKDSVSADGTETTRDPYAQK